MYTAPAPTRQKPRVLLAACTALLLSATGVGAANAVTTKPAPSPAEGRQASFRGHGLRGRVRGERRHFRQASCRRSAQRVGVGWLDARLARQPRRHHRDRPGHR